MDNVLYFLALFLGKRFLYLVSLVNQKQRKWINGQKGLLPMVKKDFDEVSEKTIWIHAASLGEYEQAKPIINTLKTKFPSYGIVVTLFSPSGYEPAYKEKIVDHVYYLPLDFRSDVQQFLDSIQPALVLFVKYEFWRNYCFEIKKREIPFLSISTRMHDKQVFFKWYGKPFRKTLSCFTHFFTQDDYSKTLLHSLNLTNATFSGDTRYDRVSEIALTKKDISVVVEFKGESKLLVVGSCWSEDIDVLLPAFETLSKKGWKFVLAPHSIDTSHIDQLESKLNNFSIKRYSRFSNLNTDILFIDNIGLLSSIYQYGDIAYVGGAFGKGLHNIMEPAVYGIPIVFGPADKRFTEAVDFINHEFGFQVNHETEAEEILDKLASDDSFRKDTGKKAAEFIQKSKGATAKIVDFCDQFLSSSL